MDEYRKNGRPDGDWNWQAARNMVLTRHEQISTANITQDKWRVEESTISEYKSLKMRFTD